MSPLPEDPKLPSGWLCERVRENELVARYEEGGLEVAATRTDDASLLPFEMSGGWDLTCRIRAGESVSERTIGRATTRSAAVETLRSCMERVRTLVRTTDSTDEISLGSVVDEIQREAGTPAMPYGRAVGD